MENQAIQTRIMNGVGYLTFNRPDSMNAFNSQLIIESNVALNQFNANDKVKCIIIHGNGRCFSAGFDMKETAEKNISGEDQWRSLLTTDFEFIMQFWNSTKPTIAAAHGYCIGGALEVLMACDLAVAGESTLFGAPEVLFGSGLVAMLAPYVTGPKQAKELLLTGNDKFAAQRCFEMGILNKIVPDGSELDAAVTFANQISKGSTQSVQITKKSINRAYENAQLQKSLIQSLEDYIDIESNPSPERKEFNRIRSEKSLKAALEWRSGRSE